jgi:hypothetical protein
VVPSPTRRLNPSAMALQTGLVAYKHERTEAMTDWPYPMQLVCLLAIICVVSMLCDKGDG